MSKEISVPFHLELNDKEVTHTITQGTVGTGMSSTIITVLDSYIRKGPFNPFKVGDKKENSQRIEKTRPEVIYTDDVSDYYSKNK